MRRSRICFALLLFTLLVAIRGSAQTSPPPPVDLSTSERGVPLIRNFLPKDYGGRATNWAVVQDQRGVIYIGNESGVLEYDGVRWRLIPTPSHTVVRSLAIDPHGRVYVGAVGEIGYLQANAIGDLAFVSLNEKLAPAERDFADVWSTWATADSVYFGTVDRVIRIRGAKVRTFRPGKSFALSFLVRDRFFVREVGRGLVELKNDQLVPVSGMERFAEEKIYAMLPWNGASGDILLGTRPDGFFVFHDGALVPLGSDEERTLLRNELLYRAAVLSDGTIAAATVQGGVHLLDHDGNLRLRLTKADGIADDSVMALMAEGRSGLWLATTNGISRLEVPAPLSQFDERRGLQGTPMAALRHDGALYVGTTLGLFRLAPGATHDARFEPVAGMRNQTWELASAGDSLLVANNEGLFEVRGLESRLIRTSLGASTAILPSRHQPGRWFVGLQSGIVSLRREGARWIDEGTLPGIPAEVRKIDESDDGTLWAGTWGEGVFRITFPGEGPPVVEKITKGLPSLGLVHVWRIGGAIRMATEEGIFRFDEKTRGLVPDEKFAPIFRDGSRRVIAMDASDRLAVIASEEARNLSRVQLVAPGSNGVYAPDPRRWLDFAAATIAVVQPDPDGVMWVGSPDELYRYDARIATPSAGSPALIRRVSQSAKTLFGGASLRTGGGPRLEYSRNALRFEFGVPAFDRTEANRFQYTLEGYDSDWSAWSDETFKEYTNLPPGRYRLRLRARDVRGAVGPEASYAFSVLSPWYRTPWAYGLYALALLALGWIVVRWRVWRVEQEKRALEARVTDRTRELEERTGELAETVRQLDAARDAAESATRAKSEFLANMSHELRTPLNAILGFSQVLDRSRTLASDDHVNLGIIRRSGEHLLGLINDVLSISKIEAGKLTLNETAFDLDELIRSVTSMMRERAGSAGLELLVDVASELPRGVRGDDGKLRQVLLNLLGNAVKFTARGHVTLRASWREGRAHFEVEDTGPGMTEAETASLFEPFVQTESGRRAKEGTGLGLVITRNIVTLMGGDIAVSSAKGKGTTFSFDVELPAAAVVDAAHASRVIGLAAGERPRRILVADDTPENRLFLVKLLGGIGLQVIEAADGEEAVEKWESEKPDLILMDMRMPRVDGRAATRRIRERESSSGTRVPIVALTASAFEHEREPFLADGADEFLTKPVREERLFEIIERTTGARFERAAAERIAPRVPAALIGSDRVARLTSAESDDLHRTLESGSPAKALEVAARIRLRDADLGDSIITEIRAFRIDHLLDLLETKSRKGADA